MTTTDRIKLLLELGEADPGKDWPDYLQYGFVETDVPARQWHEVLYSHVRPLFY